MDGIINEHALIVRVTLIGHAVCPSVCLPVTMSTCNKARNRYKEVQNYIVLIKILILLG